MNDIVVIPLNKGKFTIVSPEDAYLQEGWNLTANESTPGRWYARASRTTADGKLIDTRLHRIVMDAPKGMVVDHLNGDGLDNRRENLRVVTFSENGQNRKSVQSNNKSGYHGVYWDKRDRRWLCQISVNGKKLHVGSFLTAEEAAEARDKAAIENYGEVVYLNFPHLAK